MKEIVKLFLFVFPQLIYKALAALFLSEKSFSIAQSLAVGSMVANLCIAVGSLSVSARKKICI